MKTASIALAVASLVGFPSVAGAQIIARVSESSSRVEGNANSSIAAISSDGRFVAFQSDAWNLVPFDGNLRTDVFLRDVDYGTTIRVSVDSSGSEGNNDSYRPSISSDGTVVAFESYATNLVAGDNNGTIDAFILDTVSGVPELMNVDSSGVHGNGTSQFPAVSADGTTVAFFSTSTNLVNGDNNHLNDVFVHDRVTGLTERVSVSSSGAESNGVSFSPAVSGDGAVVAFLSDATNLVAGDTNGKTDVFVHDRTTGVTERVNVDSSGAQANDASAYLAISADGRFVAFHSWASNLVTGDTNKTSDIFVHDRQTDVTERVSLDSNGAEANSGSEFPSLSDDGQIVVFDSYATNLVSGDTNGQVDVFRRDRAAGVTERVSITPSGVEGDSASTAPKVSADGLVVAFSSSASNLVPDDDNGATDVFEEFSCTTQASWSNFGAGFPGTLGVPALSSSANPVLGTTVTIDVANSSGLYTVALVFVGFQQTDVPTSWGPHLLVVPIWSELIGLPPSGNVLSDEVPPEPRLCGFKVEVQAFELDPGATNGVSSTQGLELVLGR